MSRLRQRIAEAQVAVLFLTRLPAGRLPATVPTVAEAAWAFPLAGLLVGLISGVVFISAATVLPALPSAGLALAASALVTGALHEDGLADLADGFGGGRDKEAKLAIMRDSNIGSYGVVALILVLGLSATAMTEAASLALFLAIGTFSRAAMVAALALMPPARADGLGHGATLKPGWRLGAAFAIALIVLLATGAAGALIAIAVAATVVAALAMHQIGGQTGDVMGAIQKTGETAAWLTAAALLS